MQHKLFTDDALDDLLFHLSSESDTVDQRISIFPSSFRPSPEDELITDDTMSHDSLRNITSDDDASANPFSDDPNESVTRVVLVENSLENDQVSLKLYLKVGNGYKEVKFPFHLGVDTPAAVAKEMVVALNLSDLHYNLIATGIADTLAEANLVPHGQVTTISQAIEGDNGHVILSQTTVDPHQKYFNPLPSIDTTKQPIDAIDELLASETPVPTATTDNKNQLLPSQQQQPQLQIPPQEKLSSAMILEMLDEAQLQQPFLSTTPNTTTTITVVPQPNPTNPNSILESLVDQMKHGVGKKTDFQKSPPNSPQKKLSINSIDMEDELSPVPTETTVIQEDKSSKSQLTISIPNKDTGKPPIPKSQPTPKTTPTSSSQSDEVIKLWHQLVKQQKGEEEALRQKHKLEREEFKKKYPMSNSSTPATPLESPGLSPNDSGELKVRVTPSKSFKNLSDKLICDLETRITRDLTSNFDVSSQPNQVTTTTTIVNNLNKTNSMGGTQVYKINTTSMQTTSSVSPNQNVPMHPQIQRLNSQQQIGPTKPTNQTGTQPAMPQKNVFQNRSTGHLESVNNIPSSHQKVDSMEKENSDDLSSMISRNLNLLSMGSSTPALFTTNTAPVVNPQLHIKTGHQNSPTISTPLSANAVTSGRVSPTVFGNTVPPLQNKLPLQQQTTIDPLKSLNGFIPIQSLNNNSYSGSASQPLKFNQPVLIGNSSNSGSSNMKDTPVS
jgi:hypothetical protein